jgi:hypothetical protein
MDDTLAAKRAIQEVVNDWVVFSDPNWEGFASVWHDDVDDVYLVPGPRRSSRKRGERVRARREHHSFSGGTSIDVRQTSDRADEDDD